MLESSKTGYILQANLIRYQESYVKHQDLEGNVTGNETRPMPYVRARDLAHAMLLRWKT